MRVFFLSSEGEARFTQCVNHHYAYTDPRVGASLYQIPQVDANFTVDGITVVKIFAMAVGVGQGKRRYKAYVRYPLRRRRGGLWGGEVLVAKGSHDASGFVNMRKGDSAIAKKVIQTYVYDCECRLCY